LRYHGITVKFPLLFIAWGLYLVAGISPAHETGHGTAGPHLTSAQKAALFGDKSALKSISSSYIKYVEPIFRTACFDCHSTFTRYPWYHRLPFIRGMMDRDISTGRMHLDMSNGFPFGGHATSREDLDAITEVLADGKMPPLDYRLMHRDARLSDAQKKDVILWVGESAGLIDRTPARKTKNPAESWGAIKSLRLELDGLLASGKLEKVHHIAYAIRDLVAGMPDISSGLSGEGMADLRVEVQVVRRLASRLDEAGDAGDSAKVKSLAARLDTELGKIAALYPAGALNASRPGPAAVYTCPMHPEVLSNQPGRCPKCGMDLVVKKP